MFRKNIVSTNFKPLGKTHKGFTITPSPSVYYGRYPFKVVLNSDQSRVLLFRENVFMFGFNSLSERFRMYTNYNKQQVYLFLSDIKDLNTTLAAWPDLIETVHGPINKQHREKLIKPDTFVAVRKQLYFKKYDCKVSIHRPFRWHLSMASRINGQDTFYQEVRKFISEQMEGKHYNHMNLRYLYTFFCNKKDFDQVYPFLKMMYQDANVYITECMIHKE